MTERSTCVCVQCGDDFESGDSRLGYLYCSISCKRKAARARKRGGPPLVVPCASAACGNVAEAAGFCRYHVPLTVRLCSYDGCWKESRAKGLCSTHYNRQNPNNHVKVEQECVQCGKLVVKWETSGDRAVTCSLKCRADYTFGVDRPHRRLSSKELVHVGPASPMCAIPNSHPARRRPPKRRTFVVGLCRWCREPFTHVRIRYHWPRYCSKKCKGTFHQSAYAFRISDTERFAIYERDKFTCFCKQPVDMSLARLDGWDDWAPSLDHIEPQAWALIPDHSPKNLRLAHNWCNSLRGDETFVTDEGVAARVAERMASGTGPRVCVSAGTADLGGLW